MNRAKWGHLETKTFAELLQAGQTINKKYGISFIWKTATCNRDHDSEGAITRKEIQMSREYGWGVLDLHNLTSSLSREDYHDNHHLSETANSMFNNALLTMI